MPAFDTPLAPTSVAPANTSATELDPGNTTGCYVYLTINNMGAAPADVSFGVTPNGGSLQAHMTEVSMPAKESLPWPHPIFLRFEDVLTVQTSVPDDVVFSVTGVQSS